ncbi:MAG TPA: ribonuclease R [Candidatus Hydrothermia bacterium]|nr:ribonuclease R [Candidatus Hydrothermae bacterium]MDD3649088.1 ribonuclease R [Candidatus Hydrothermia bacterium]MDD5573468.1 ribonuclease R [Candidatus Hydrothermia bacterium]HOK23027.1 ribonuclease R [Candidatus Hydrothermia bacterium]HOL23713.1 ribonuclease R [Candidatus Hydrothermia bacterium]
MADIQKSIINLLKRNSKGLSFNALRGKLGIRGRQVQLLERELGRLLEDGIIYRLDNKYLLASEETERGYFQKFAGGFGFLLREGKEDVFIPPHATRGAMDGDYVLVAVLREKEGKKPEGRILKVLKKADKRYSGTLKKRGKHFIVVPDDKTLPSELLLEKSRKGKMKLLEDMKVVFKLKLNKAQIIEAIGMENDPSIDYRLVVAKYGLKEEFPKKVFDDIRSIKISGKREDLRNKYIITIDPKDAKDFDDAISVEKDGKLYLVGVHIADVSSYVAEDSKLDKEAMARGCSVYLIDKVIPMLPDELSSDLCSLKPGEDRFTMSVFMWIDDQGNVIKRRFSRSIINSKARLSYEDAQRIINGENLGEDSVSIFVGDSFKHIREFLILAREVAEVLGIMRQKRGSLDFDLPEPVVRLTAQGQVISVSPSLRLETHRIIEEFMVKANETVAEYLEEKSLPCIFRVHEAPEEIKVRDFVRITEGILGTKFSFDKIDKYTIQGIIKNAEEMGHGPVVSYLLLRSMKKAKYSVENIGHFGLSSESYVHFTSPIRRYPDLTVHRILKKALGAKAWIPGEEYINKLTEIAKQSTLREDISEKAEWELIDLKKYEFMKQKVGQIFEGVVTHTTPNGIFVEIEEFLTEGFVSWAKESSIVSFNDENKEVFLGTKRIRLGDRIKVRVISVNKWARSMELELYEME